MQLYLIRHAESQNNASPPYARVEDPRLTAIGRRQAEALAVWMRTLRRDYLITSPFLRTLQTTRAIIDANADAREPVLVWHDVFERGGCYRGHGPDAIEGGPGLGRLAIAAQIGDDPDRCVIEDSIEDDGWWRGRRRETDDQCVARAKALASKLQRRFTDGEVVVMIIHAEFKRALMAEMLGPGVDPHLFGPINNTGVSKLMGTDSGWRLQWFNSITHLPSPMITEPW